jgi:hypothetical protein
MDDELAIRNMMIELFLNDVCGSWTTSAERVRVYQSVRERARSLLSTIALHKEIKIHNSEEVTQSV